MTQDKNSNSNPPISGKKERLSSLPKFCELCGIDYALSKHRIMPGREGGKYVLSNVLVTCLNCHKLCEDEVYTREEQLRIVYKRLDPKKIKKCKICKIDKLRSEFYKNKRSKDGLRHICKECNNKKK